MRQSTPALVGSGSRARMLAVLVGLAPTTLCGSPSPRAGASAASETAAFSTTRTAPAGKPGLPARATVPRHTVDLSLRRLEPGSGPVLVSSGIPLPPGWLRASELGQVRLLVRGKEQRIALAPLYGKHTDGSLRSLLLQVSFPLERKETVPARLELGERAAAWGKATPVTWSLPEAVALPTSAAYLVSTGLVGPTLAIRDAPRQPKFFRKYEADFIRFSDLHWRQEFSKWGGNYYDRAFSHYAFWARTGDPTYWERATAIVVAYRKDYIEANDYKPSPHWTQIDGLALHYWLTGDERSRTAVGKIAVNLQAFGGKRLNTKDHAWMDSRIQARVLTSKLRARELDTDGGSGLDWAPLLEDDLRRILASQYPDGSYRWKSQCYQSSNFMAGLLNDALIRYYTGFAPDPRIPDAVRKSVDFLWTQWLPRDRAFSYYSGNCPGHGGTQPSPDLSMLMVNGFGWLYTWTGQGTYRKRGDQVFAGAVAKAYLTGSKQFNQQYYDSFQYLAYRNGAVTARQPSSADAQSAN